jgi:ATP-dependent Clp protease adaptor protein ClpS
MIKNQTSTKEKTLIKNKVKIKKPKQYRVLLHNNMFTPFQVVTDVLKKVFNLDEKKAYEIMMYCHNNGASQCFEGTKSQCEAKHEQALDYCKKQHEAYPGLLYNLLEFSVDDME